MARVVKAMPKGTLSVPVLSSPELAVKSAQAILEGLGRMEPASEAVLVGSASGGARR